MALRSGHTGASVPRAGSSPGSSPRPLGVFQLVGFVCACYVVRVLTEEEDSCMCGRRAPTTASSRPGMDAPGNGGGRGSGGGDSAFSWPVVGKA